MDIGEDYVKNIRHIFVQKSVIHIVTSLSDYMWYFLRLCRYSSNIIYGINCKCVFVSAGNA